jgi:hypothetical protein
MPYGMNHCQRINTLDNQNSSSTPEREDKRTTGGPKTPETKVSFQLTDLKKNRVRSETEVEGFQGKTSKRESERKISKEKI